MKMMMIMMIKDSKKKLIPKQEQKLPKLFVKVRIGD